MDRAQWDERYDTEELVWRAEPNRFVVREVEGMPPGRALDLACGEGRNALWLAERGWEVVGVDFSATGLAKAARLAGHRGVSVTWEAADVRDWDPPHHFDLVLLAYLQLPAPDRRRALAVAAGALGPGGTLLVIGHDTTNPTDGVGGPQDPSVLFGPDDVVADLEGLEGPAPGPGGLVVERAERVRRPVDTPEGAREAVDALVRAHRPR